MPHVWGAIRKHFAEEEILGLTPGNQGLREGFNPGLILVFLFICGDINSNQTE
jgi:hypothetical protein